MSRLGLASLLVLIASPAAAQDTVSSTFDFDAPTADQRGDYTASTGAELTSSLGRVATIAGWPDRAQTVRLGVTVDNGGVETPRAVVTVPVADLDVGLRGLASLDGTDVTAALPDGTALDRYVAGVSAPSGRGVYQVRVPTLPVGPSTFFLYAGSRAPGPVVDELAFFTDPSPAVRYFPVGSFGAATVTLLSFIDANEVVFGASPEALARLESRNAAASTFGFSVAAAGPIAGAWDGASGDAVIPESFAGMRFAIPAPRFDEAVILAAPFGDATVTFSYPALADVAVPSGTAITVDTVVLDNEAVVFTSDVPVLVVRGSVSGDVTPMPPAALELLGGGDGTTRVAAGPGGANVSAYRSDGGMQTVAVPEHTSVALSGGGSQGGGPSIRVIADAPVGAFSNADGDGGEAVALLPIDLLGGEAVMPVGAQFVVVGATLPRTSCELVQADGTVIASGTTSATPPPNPGKLFFGNAVNGLHLPGPASLRCDQPVFALFEEPGSEAEKLMVPAPAHRPHVGGPLTVTPSDIIEARFAAGTSSVSTPSLAFERPAARIARFSSVAASELGSRVVYRVSIDGGASWMIPSGGALVAATGDEGAAPGDFTGVALEMARELTVQAVFETDGLADASVDEIAVEVELVPPPSALRVGAVPSPQAVGTAFTTTIELVDEVGAVVRVGGDVLVSLNPAEVAPEQTLTLVDGAGEVSVTPVAGSPMTFVVATMDGLSGSSNAFDVIATNAGRTLSVVSGAGQSDLPGATLPEPIVVTLGDDAGAPIADEEISFAVTRGDGSVAPASATTDAMGRASVTWTLGPEPGGNALRASLSGDPSVSLMVSATAVEEEMAGGGCDCRAAPASRTSRGAWLLPLGVLALLWRRRRR